MKYKAQSVSISMQISKNREKTDTNDRLLKSNTNKRGTTKQKRNQNKFIPVNRIELYQYKNRHVNEDFAKSIFFRLF